MFKKQHVIILDSECSMRRDLKEVSWIICNLDGDIVKQQGYYQPKVELFPKYNETIGKLSLYENLQGFITPVECFNPVSALLLRDIEEFNIQKVLCYNAQFDRGLLLENNFTIPDYLWGDLMTPIIETVVHTPQYQLWSQRNKICTEKGYYSYSAENIYKYLTQQVNYQETHVAILDCFIELQIYKFLRKSGFKTKDYLCNSGGEFFKYIKQLGQWGVAKNV